MMWPGRARGMTMIEAVVALALLAMLSTGILTAFRFGQRCYEQIARVDRSSSEIVTAQRFLRRVLESVYPLRREFGLEGTPDSLVFTAPMPAARGAAGHYRYEIRAVTQEAGSRDLIVVSGLDRNGDSAAVRRDVLVPNVRAVEWAYLEPEDRDASPLSPQGQWVDRWISRRQLPALVRMRVVFPPGDPRQWPELVVELRVTADASCQFDAIAQACRKVQT